MRSLYPFDILGMDSRGLLIACGNGNTQRVREFLELGVNPDSRSNFWDDRRTPLMEAALWDHLEVAKVLIEYGADLDLTDNNGYTALMLSIYDKDDEIEDSDDILEMSKLLLTSGCDVDVVAQGNTFLNMLPDVVRIETEEYIASLIAPKPAKR